MARFSVSLVPLCFFLASACASPVQDLWPPQPGGPSHAIIVSLDTWHAMIAFPMSEQPVANSEQPATSSSGHQPSAINHQLFEEWGYAEQAWYLEGRQGLTGILRALFWPSAGVVEVGQQVGVWADRTPQPPAERFLFQLSQEGYVRLRQHLTSTIGGSEPVETLGGSTFYPAVRSYHLFHHCHQYTALALREAGLPIAPFWAVTRSVLAMQLHRAERLGAEAQSEPTQR